MLLCLMYVSFNRFSITVDPVLVNGLNTVLYGIFSGF